MRRFIWYTVGNAVLNSKLNSVLGHNIASAVLPLGLPPSSLGAFIGLLAAGDTASILKLPGVTPAMLGAGYHALQESFLYAFKYIWIVMAGKLS